MPSPLSLSPPIFVGGAGRSGTTLLRVILDSHPNISCGPELKVIPDIVRTLNPGRYGEAFARNGLGEADAVAAVRGAILPLLAARARETGKPRVAEKTPHNVFVFPALRRAFPASSLLHMVRDGRDVVASLLRQRWLGADGRPVAYTANATAAAKYWLSAVTAGGALPGGSDVGVVQVRYETLVTAPEPLLRTMMADLGEPWSDDLLAHERKVHTLGAAESSNDSVVAAINTKAVGRWAAELSRVQRAEVAAVAGEALVALGYADSVDGWVGVGA